MSGTHSWMGRSPWQRSRLKCARTLPRVDLKRFDAGKNDSLGCA
jgi:hypothetical protein